jgi:hypothetical protein
MSGNRRKRGRQVGRKPGPTRETGSEEGRGETSKGTPLRKARERMHGTRKREGKGQMQKRKRTLKGQIEAK